MTQKPLSAVSRLYGLFIYTFGLAMITLALTGGFVSAYIDKSPAPGMYTLIYMGFCFLGGLVASGVAMYLRWQSVKWREENPELHAQREFERQERQKNLAMYAVGWSELLEGMIEGVGRLFIGIIVLAIVAVVLYVAYSFISGLPITVAIILGACIIGLALSRLR